MNRMSIILLACVLISGCDRAPGDKPAAAGQAVSKSNCYVCGDHALDVTASTPWSDFSGQRFYFCSEECKTDFLKEPKKYAARANPATQPSPPKS